MNPVNPQWEYHLPDGRILRRRSKQPRFMIVGKTTPHRWNWLGKPGHTDHASLHYELRLLGTRESAEACADKKRRETFYGENGRPISEAYTAVGDNRHLVDVPRFEEVWVIEGKEVGDDTGSD